MQAVILAGGVGSRLQQLTGGKPKCLAEIGDRPLILHQLEALADHGVGPVLMVVGYEHEAIRAVVGGRVEYIVNERFRETNSLYSLLLAREWIKGPFLLLNSDLLFDPQILGRLLEEPGNVLVYDSTSSQGHEQTKVAIRERKVVDLGKDLPAASARGESLGLLKFDAEGASAMLETAQHLIAADGNERAWVIEATRAVCKTVPIYGVNIAGLPWAELDFPHDLEKARAEIWPAITKGRWRRAVYWHRTRWAAGVLIALVVAMSGWFASTRVGPASIDWENVPLPHARLVSLQTASGHQKWWVVPDHDSVGVEVSGGGPVRVEFRLLLNAQHADSGRYVIGVTLDGEPHDWDAFTATGDSSVVLPGVIVGDRDRLQFDLPPGRHILKVALLAGDGDSLLVRVRQPE